MIDDSIKIVLDQQQIEIINCVEKYICVSACPGAGKTYTLVKKIQRELSEIKDYQGIIACSFTKESAKEIKLRLNLNKKIEENCFIGTIDSFVLNLIIKPFLNRYLLGRRLCEKKVIINSVTIDNNSNLNRFTRYYDTNLFVRQEANGYINEWYDDLKNGNYRISFASYLLAENIVKMELFHKYFALRFPTIYIDEAQDLNFFQHKLLFQLKEKTNINIILFGDPNQSIYRFRGARPEYFNSLSKIGYCLKNITVSVRCHPSILYFANKIFDSSIPVTFSESHVSIIDKIDLNFLTSLSGGIYILVETNNTGINIYEEYKDDFDILFSKKLDSLPKDYDLNQDIIDELIKYYINYDNINDRYKYPLDDLILYLKNFVLNCNRNNFKINDRSFIEFMYDAANLLNIDISLETLQLIEEKLMDEKYKYYYYVSDKTNKIMTIHSSKGLESDNVIIYLDSTFSINDEFKNKLFVAITRARKNVFICCADCFVGKDYINNLLDFR